MRLKAVLLLLVCLCAAAVSAQGTTTWYYGWNPIDGQLFAYTAEGDVQMLLENVEEVQYITRINDENAFGVFFESDSPEEKHLYFLTPDEARPLTLTFDFADLSEDAMDFALQDFTDDYALFASNYSRGGAYGLLADFEAGTVELLSDMEINNGVEQTRFSENGQLLRYVRFDDEERDSWSLIERTLAAGDDRIFYSGKGYPSLIGDESGEHWLVRLPREGEENPVLPYVVVDTSGESMEVAEATSDNIIGATLFEDSIFTWSFDCQENCVVTLLPIAEGDEHVLRAPTTGSNIIPIKRIDDAHLLVLVTDSGESYLLGEDQAPELIGSYSPENIGQPFRDTLSPDGHYQLVLTGAEDQLGYGVWDFDQQQFVIEDMPDDIVFPFIFYNNSGFLVSNALRTFALYRYDDETVIDLPEAAGLCFDVLSDGDVLCSTRGSETIADGIYRYDPDEDSYTLLVESGYHLMR
jgi:hypothetical protein